MGFGEMLENGATVPRLPPRITFQSRLRRVPGVSGARSNAPRGKAAVTGAAASRPRSVPDHTLAAVAGADAERIGLPINHPGLVVEGHAFKRGVVRDW